MTTDKILDKLSKIKAQMESEGELGNEHAAQAFAAKLQELLLRHKLSIADVPGQVTSTKPPEIIETYVENSQDGFKYVGRRQSWSEVLASIVAAAYSCKILVTAKSNSIWFVGVSEDTKVAEFVFVKLWRLADKLAWTANRTYRKKLRDQGRGVGSGGNSGFRQAFLTGFVRRMRDRLEEQRAKILSTETSTALVPLKNLDMAISKFIDEKYPANLSAVTLELENIDGYKAGIDTANKVDLNQKGVETTETKKIGGE